MTIPAAALQRFNQLNDMWTIARATADGLRDPAEQYREEIERQSAHFAFAARDWGGRVVVEDGKAVTLQTVEKSTGKTTGMVKTWTERRTEIPELFGHAAQLQSARDRNTAARAKYAAAAERAAGFRTAVEQARSAFKALGFTVDQASGELRSLGWGGAR